MQVCHFYCIIEKNKTSRPPAVCSAGVVCDLLRPLNHLEGLWFVVYSMMIDEDDDGDDYKDDISTI